MADVQNPPSNHDENAGAQPAETPARPGPGPARPRRRWVLPAVGLLLLALLIFGVRWLAYSRTHVSTDDAQINADISSVSARVAGHITGLYADENQTVQAGQPLAQVDPRDYEVAVEQAQAALEQATSAAQAAQGTVQVTQQTGGAGISQAQAQVSANQRAAQAAAAATQMAQRGVGTARAAVVSARATAEEARREAARTRALFSQGAVSRQQADQAEAAATTAQANLQAAQAQLSSAQAAVTQARARHSQAQAAVSQAQAAVQAAQSSPTQVGVTRSQAKAAQANVAAAKARLDQARLNLSYARITSPTTGVVAQKNVEVGQYVTPGQPLFAVVPERAYVTANFKETQLRRIKPGQPATFTVDAYPGVTFRGRVASISPGTGSVFSLLPPENATGNFTKVVQRIPVRIEVDSKSVNGHPLRAGMNVVATVEVGK